MSQGREIFPLMIFEAAFSRLRNRKRNNSNYRETENGYDNAPPHILSIGTRTATREALFVPLHFLPVRGHPLGRDPFSHPSGSSTVLASS
jgi:hypothetical protein